MKGAPSHARLGVAVKTNTRSTATSPAILNYLRDNMKDNSQKFEHVEGVFWDGVEKGLLSC
jgi:hypothetical protein